MKKLLLVAFLLLSVVTLAACGKKTVTNEGTTIDFGDIFVKKSKIRVWIDDEQGDYMKAVIVEFNKKYPNIIVEHQHMGAVDARERLKTFGPSGNGADVFQFPHDHLAQAVLEDLVYALPQSTKDLLNARAHELGLSIATVAYDEQAKSFDPASPNSVERVYAVPMSVESVGLFYNKDLVATPATTMEAILTAGAAWNAEKVGSAGLTRAEQGLYYFNTSSHWADAYFMQPFLSAFDFTPFGENLNDPSAVGFADTVDALEFFVEDLKPVVAGNAGVKDTKGGENFEKGLVPYIIAGPWMHETYQKANLNYGVAQMPTLNGKEMKTFAGAMMAAVYKYSDNVSDAIKFVEFLNSDIAMQLQYEYKTKLPALKESLLSGVPGVLEDSRMTSMSDQLKTSYPMPTIPQVTYYWGPAETMITEVWNAGKAYAEAAAAAETSYVTLRDLSAN